MTRLGGGRARGQVGRLLLHFLVPAVSAAAPLAVIPAVTSRFGASGWSAVAVGMSVGIAPGAAIVGSVVDSQGASAGFLVPLVAGLAGAAVAWTTSASS